MDPDQKIYDMSVSQKQTVEIVKVLYRGADILILDEPTAVLTPQETEKLFRVLRKMRDDGKAIIIITHKMHEVESLCLTVWLCCVMAASRAILPRRIQTRTDMTNRMVGHKVTLNIERPEPVNPKPRLEVKGLTVEDRGRHRETERRFLYREKRRDPGYCRNFRLWSEGASGSDCGTSVHRLREASLI